MRSLAIAIASVLALAGAALGSPSAHVLHREILLGANPREYTYLLWRQTNPGTYYASAESLFIYQRSNSEPKFSLRTMLRTTVHTTDGNTGERTQLESFVASANVAQFLVDHDCHPAFFDSWPESIAMDARGMYYHDKGRRAYFMPMKEVRSWLDTDFSALPGAGGEDLRVVGLMKTGVPPDSTVGEMTYVMVRAGLGMDDGGQYEGIIPVRASAMTNAMNEVRARLGPPPRPKAVKR